MRSRPLRLWLSLALLAATGLAPFQASATHTGAALLPDLGMAQLTNFSVERRPHGARWLRFTTVVVNVGAGPFQVYGHTSQPNGELRVDQQIREGLTWTSDPTPYRMYFAGDGHLHWHLRDLETYELRNATAPNAPPLRTGAKHGFCFFDNTRYRLSLPGAPQSLVYSRCGFGSADTTVTFGLSVGWGDTYPSHLVDQYIDISGLPFGEYEITATADAQNWLLESNDANNGTTAIIRITRKGVTILDPGVGA
ncbi:MAG: lysyl oxidase family protein [Chloroflexota bacterium]